MVDVHALDMVLWSIMVICAIAIALAIAGMTLAWIAGRSRQPEPMTGGVRALETHREEAARDRAA